jgi:hypothetical protein
MKWVSHKFPNGSVFAFSLDGISIRHEAGPTHPVPYYEGVHLWYFEGADMKIRTKV